MYSLLFQLSLGCKIKNFCYSLFSSRKQLFRNVNVLLSGKINWLLQQQQQQQQQHIHRKQNMKELLQFHDSHFNGKNS